MSTILAKSYGENFDEGYTLGGCQHKAYSAIAHILFGRYVCRIISHFIMY